MFGQGLDKKQCSGKVWTKSNVRARSGQKAMLGQGLDKKQGSGKVWTKSKVRARSGQAMSGPTLPAQTLPEPCFLSRPCPNIARTLPQPYPNLAPTLPQPCVGQVSNCPMLMAGVTLLFFIWLSTRTPIVILDLQLGGYRILFSSCVICLFAIFIYEHK